MVDSKPIDLPRLCEEYRTLYFLERALTDSLRGSLPGKSVPDVRELLARVRVGVDWRRRELQQRGLPTG